MTPWRPCGKGPCSAEDGHDGTCAEASGFVTERQSPVPDARKSGGQVSFVLTSETGLPLTPDEAARYFAWAQDDPDPYRRGFARGVAAATRVTPPAEGDA